MSPPRDSFVVAATTLLGAVWCVACALAYPSSSSSEVRVTIKLRVVGEARKIVDKMHDGTLWLDFAYASSDKKTPTTAHYNIALGPSSLDAGVLSGHFSFHNKALPAQMSRDERARDQRRKDAAVRLLRKAKKECAIQPNLLSTAHPVLANKHSKLELHVVDREIEKVARVKSTRKTNTATIHYRETLYNALYDVDELTSRCEIRKSDGGGSVEIFFGRVSTLLRKHEGLLVDDKIHIQKSKLPPPPPRAKTKLFEWMKKSGGGKGTTTTKQARHEATTANSQQQHPTAATMEHPTAPHGHNPKPTHAEEDEEEKFYSAEGAPMHHDNSRGGEESDTTGALSETRLQHQHSALPPPLNIYVKVSLRNLPAAFQHQVRVHRLESVDIKLPTGAHLRAATRAHAALHRRPSEQAEIRYDFDEPHGPLLSFTVPASEESDGGAQMKLPRKIASLVDKIVGAKFELKNGQFNKFMMHVEAATGGAEAGLKNAHLYIDFMRQSSDDDNEIEEIESDEPKEEPTTRQQREFSNEYRRRVSAGRTDTESQEGSNAAARSKTSQPQATPQTKGKKSKFASLSSSWKPASKWNVRSKVRSMFGDGKREKKEGGEQH